MNRIIKLEPSLWEGFICHLRANGYRVTPGKSKSEPFFVNHHQTPEMTHIISHEKPIKEECWVIPEKLHQEVQRFYRLATKTRREPRAFLEAVREEM
ncbi:hypothetical protein [Vibrio astriarenae]|uniref:hypothetical protein n=1 Tax=Vibrio astriarenae TaxID=1481923 RepID=UPI003735879B